MKYSSIIFRTAKVLKECQIRRFPIDCIKILEHYSYRIYSYSYIKSQNPRLFELCGGYSSDAFTEKSLKIIAYNDVSSTGRIRFSLMHELGHIMLGHTGHEEDCEYEADLFASHILAPRVMIEHYGCKNSVDVQHFFGLSGMAANWAWIDYRRLIKQGYQKEDTELLHWFTQQKIEKPMPVSFFDDRLEKIKEQKACLGLDSFDSAFTRAEKHWLYENIY